MQIELEPNLQSKQKYSAHSHHAINIDSMLQSFAQTASLVHTYYCRTSYAAIPNLRVSSSICKICVCVCVCVNPIFYSRLDKIRFWFIA